MQGSDNCKEVPKKMGVTKAATITNSPVKNSDDFNFEEGNTDELMEKFEVIGIKMDIHKNGTLYLKELVLTNPHQYLVHDASRITNEAKRTNRRFFGGIYEANA